VALVLISFEAHQANTLLGCQILKAEEGAPCGLARHYSGIYLQERSMIAFPGGFSALFGITKFLQVDVRNARISECICQGGL
jgi:hypothetical protein